jgi:hypothetical protein
MIRRACAASPRFPAASLRVHVERGVHGRHVLFDQLFANQTHRVITADLIMHRHGLRVGLLTSASLIASLSAGKPLKPIFWANFTTLDWLTRLHSPAAAS